MCDIEIPTIIHPNVHQSKIWNEFNAIFFNMYKLHFPSSNNCELIKNVHYPILSQRKLYFFRLFLASAQRPFVAMWRHVQ